MTSKLLVIASSLLLTACAGPGGIVEEAITAAQKGDRDAYIACFTERSRPLLRGLYESADRHNPELAQMGGAGARVIAITPMGTKPGAGERARVSVQEGSETLELMVHSRAGAWRIDLLDSERILTGIERRF